MMFCIQEALGSKQRESVPLLVWVLLRHSHPRLPLGHSHSATVLISLFQFHESISSCHCHPSHSFLRSLWLSHCVEGVIVRTSFRLIPNGRCHLGQIQRKDNAFYDSIKYFHDHALGKVHGTDDLTHQLVWSFCN